MRILVTRPAADATGVADLLQARGATVMTEPLLTIEPRPAELPALDDVQALLFTSANGVRAFAGQSDRRDIPVHAVGDATAEVARAAGFTDVQSAAGDVAALAAAVIAARRPADGPLLQVAGTVSAGDLSGALGEAGFAVDRVVLYEAVPATALGADLVAALRLRQVDGALFFSPRTARLFLDLVDRAGVRADLAHVSAYALSPAVAEVLDAGAFRCVTTAAAPTLPALLDAFDAAPPVAEASPAEMAPAQPTPEAEPTPDETTKHPADPLSELLPASAAEAPEAAAVMPEPGARPAWTSAGSATMDTPTSAPPPRRRSAAPAWLALLLLIVLGGVGSAPWWSPALLPLLPWARTPAAPPAETAGLADRLARLERATAPLSARIDAVERQVAALQPAAGQPVQAPATPSNAPAPPAAGPDPALTARLDTLGTRVDGLQTAVAAASAQAQSATRDATTQAASDKTLAGQVQALDSRVGALEQAARTAEPKLDAVASRTGALADQVAALGKAATASASARLADAVVPAAAAIRAAVDAGTPFPGPLAIVADDAATPPLAQATAVIGPALATLKPLAARGVEPLRQLRADFPAVARTMRAATQSAVDTPTGWWGKARRSLTDLVTVTREGQDAPGLDGVLATAGAALERDDLAGAATAMRRAGGPAVQAAQPWLSRADGRLKALAAADALVAAVGHATLDGPSASPPASVP